MVRRLVSLFVAGCVFAAVAGVAVAPAADAVGTVTMFTLPIAGSMREMATGPDGNVWFIEGTSTGVQIGRVTPSGTFTMFPLPAGADANGITAGPDDAMWFNDTSSLGKITMTGVVTEYPLVGSLPLPSTESAITAGPDGNLWLAGFGSHVLRTSTTGAYTVFTPSGTSHVGPITSGPDGRLW
jgi:virginiamycin B lyase